MSDFGLFESDEAAQSKPQVQARLAARKMEAAIDVVRAKFGRFLLGATGIDEFGDRWHLSKHDIRAAVEPYVFPNTGTMRRLHNALKQDWKVAHPYKLAEDRDAPIQDIDETFTPSDANLVPDGNWPAYRNSVDQDGPEKVQNAFTPGGDSGSDRTADRHHLPNDREHGFYPSEDGDGSWSVYREEYPVGDFSQEGDPVAGSQRLVRRGLPGEEEAYGYANDLQRSNNDFHPGGGRHEAARLVADIYTDFARANNLRVASLDTLDIYASTGIHEADYRLLASMIVRAAEDCSEECDDDKDEDDDSDSEDSDSDSEAPSASESDESDSDDDSDEDYDFGGEEAAEDDSEDDESDDSEEPETESGGEDYGFGDTDSDGDHDDADHHGGEQFTVPEHAPELPPEMMQEIPQDDPGGSAPVPPEVIDSLLGLPEGTIEQLLLEEVEQGGDPGMSGPPAPPQGGGDDFFGGGGDEPEPPRTARRRQAGGAGSYYDQMEQADQPPLPRRKEKSDAVRRLEWMNSQTQGPRTGEDIGGGNLFGYGGENRHNAARLFWAADDNESSESDSGGGESGGGQQQQAAPAQDPAAMGMAQPMMPPPGSQAVAPPAPPAPMEDQPAEDALLDTANQAIMQMIDRETQEYQQIIDPLSQALQAIQFAQQVEQSEHPMDVTPPEGTVDVSPAAAPGGQAPQQPMQQMARRRVAGGDPYADSYGDIDRGGPSIDDPTSGPTYRRVHPDIEKALRRRFDGGGSAGWHPDKPGVILHDLGNFWDGPREVKHLGGGELEYTCPYTGRSDRFNAAGYYTHDGEHRPWSSDHYGSMRRQAKVETALRNAAALIASRYRLSATGHRMLLQATLGRRGYEHVVEALKLVPADFRKAAAIHMAHLFAAGNQRFNKDIFMKTVMASKPRDRAWDAWASGRDRGVAEHGRHDLEDYDGDDPDYSGYGTRKKGPLRPGWDDREASRSRLPFELPRRTAGETWTHTPTMDAFEFPNAGEVPRIDDNHDINDLPVMPGADPHGKNVAAASQKAIDRFQRWQTRQQQRGLPVTEGEAAVHNFMQTSRPYRKRVGPDAQNMIHEHLGLQPDAVKTPKAKPVKAVNPALGKGSGQTPKAPKAKAPAPKAAPKTAEWGTWEPTKQASFFTRKVPGWRWDDHLNGYLSKEGMAFTCNCGQKVAAPSYKTCDCGKIWNVYAIGDTHHLASDTAEVFIAREIPVRDNVIMANRKLAGGLSQYHVTTPSGTRIWHAESPEHAAEQHASAFGDDPDEEVLDIKRGGPSSHDDTPAPGKRIKQPSRRPPNRESGVVVAARAQESHQELLAEIERLADWTKYDSPDPSRDPKAKPPSTKIPKQPKDWTNREFTGPDKGQWRDPDPTELPRKTRKKK